MKKLPLIISLILCIEASGQELEKDCLVTSDLGLLNYTQVQLFSSNYNALHAGLKKKHTKAYYINSKVLVFLDSFIKVKAPKYFGFNVYFLSYRTNASRRQSLTNQSLLYIVPVFDDPANPARDTTADYSALNNFFLTLTPGYFNKDSLNKGISCYGECDSSLMAWTYSTGFTRLNERPGGALGNDILLFSTSKATHSTHRSNYISDHNELSAKQTKWIYFDASKIELLALFILNGNNIDDYPMMGLYFGSYNSIAIMKQAHKDQTMLTFVPMRKMENQNYEPDVCRLVNFWNSNSFIRPASLRIGVNHGELCPDHCPQGSN